MYDKIFLKFSPSHTTEFYLNTYFHWKGEIISILSIMAVGKVLVREPSCPGNGKNEVECQSSPSLTPAYYC